MMGQRAIRLPVALALCALLCVPGAVLAEGQGVEVRAVSPALQEVDPGHIISLSFSVMNHTEREEEFAEILELPNRWRPLMPAGSFRLRPNEETTRLVAFQVPRDAAAGRYEVGYGVRSERDYAIQDADVVAVVVLPVTNLEFLLEAKPDSVIAGQSYEIKLRLINHSNVEMPVSLQVSSREGYPATLEPEELELGAGMSAPVLVSVETDEEEQRPRTHYVRVHAEGRDNGEVRTSTSVGVEIIPRVTGDPDMQHRIPAELTMWYRARDGDGAAQLELRGAGYLDEVSDRYIEFFMRAPSTRDRGFLGRRDEYRINYFTDDYGVRLGDQSYRLSRLTSYHRYGRGLGVDYHPVDALTGVGAYYVEDRWLRPDRAEGGLYVEHEVDRDILARLNLLRRDRSGTDIRPRITDTIWSLEGEGRPLEQMNLRAEYAFAKRNEGDAGLTDSAYRVEVDGRVDRGYYRAATFRAGPDYYGYHHDSQRSYVSLTYPLADRLRGNLSWNRYERNLDLRPDRFAASRETLWRLGGNYRLEDGWSLSLNVDDFARYDLLTPARFDFREQALRLGVGHSAPEYSARAEVRVGNQEDRLRDESRTAWNYRLYGTWRPERELYLTAFAGFGDNDSLRGSRLLRDSSNLGFSARWRPHPDLDLSFWYRKYGFDAHDRPESDQFSVRMRHALPNDHAVTAEARHHSRDLGPSSTTYQVAYTIPFGVAVGRRTTVGAIEGRIYDEEVAARPGVEGAILKVDGATAVSDERGDFIFPALAPGVYELSVDRASIGLDRVVEQGLPMSVEVVGGETMELDLGVVRAATVSGTVLVVPGNNNNLNNNQNPGEQAGNDGAVVGDPRNNNSNGNNNGQVTGEPGNNNNQGEATGLANVLVELSNERETVRRVTNRRGEFLFENMRPGEWTLKVYDHNVPAYHYLETTEQELTLGAGESREMTIRILPRTREIRFIDEGVIRRNGR